MSYFGTCFNCDADKETCSRRQHIREGIKGLGITSLKFNCPERLPKFHTGQRVKFSWRYYEQISQYDHEEFTVEFYGTIMREMPGNRRFSIRVDQEHEDYDCSPRELLKNPEFTSVRPAEIEPLGEPDRAMCSLCRAYRGDPSDIERLCYSSGSCAPVGCLKADGVGLTQQAIGV